MTVHRSLLGALFLAGACLCSVGTSSAAEPVWRWAERLGSTNGDFIKDVVTDSSGYIYAVGQVEGAADLNGDGDTNDSGESAANYGELDAFVSAFNANGLFQWARRLGGTGRDSGIGISTDSNGHVFVTGYVTGDADLNGDTDRTDGGAESASGYGDADAFISVFNPSGSFLWAKRLGGTGYDEGRGIHGAADGRLYVTGAVTGAADFNGDRDMTDTGETAGFGGTDAFISVFNASSGSTLFWAKRLGGSAFDSGHSVISITNSRVYAVGTVNGSADLNADGDQSDGGESGTGYQTFDGFISVFASNGTPQWSKRLGGLGSDELTDITADYSGYVFVSGYVNGDADLNGDGDRNDGLAESSFGYGQEDAVLVGFSQSSGSFQWAKRLGGSGRDWGWGVSTDLQGNVLLAGAAGGTADLNADGDRSDSSESSAGYGGLDAFVSAFRSTGTHQWAKRLGGANDDAGNAAAFGTNGDFCLAGYANGNADMNGDSDRTDGGAESGSGYGNSDAFVSVFRRQHTISGTIRSGGTPLSGVAIDGGALGWTTTNASGFYSFGTVAHATNYTLTPSFANWSFSPLFVSGTATSDVTADFTGFFNSYAISGTVSTAAGPLAGALVDAGIFGSSMTDAQGHYGIAGIPAGSGYIAAASKTGYAFSPANASGVLYGNLTINFTAVDSDLDGISDAQEQTDGTDPLDRGSYLSVLSRTLCSEWNGFLADPVSGLTMWNIMEHVNMSPTTLQVQSTIYNLTGAPMSMHEFSVLPGAQVDLLVHDMAGWSKDSYGKVCSTIAGAAPGELDGRMVYYKPNDPAGSSYQFAFAMPFLNGTTGAQFVPFNTFQPSLDPVDASNIVVNWIQLTNLEAAEKSGELIFHDRDGTVLGRQDVALAGGARQDFSGHQFGTNLVGMIEWQPDDITARFQLRNVRYMYDNPYATNYFDTAFQLEGMVGSGKALALPLDTAGASAIIEVGNTSAADQTIGVTIYSSSGVQLDARDVTLPAYGSEHIITDSILNGGQGIGIIQGRTAEGAIAVAMHYGRTATFGVKYMYGIPARQAVGATLRSSYNTFLKQSCRLLLINPTAANVSANISMVRYDGAKPLLGEDTVVPPHGLVDYNLCSHDGADNYGVATVQAGTVNALVSSVVRVGNNNDYRFPTPVRQ